MLTQQKNEISTNANQILLSGNSTDQLVEIFRPMINQEIRLALSQQEDKLISPAEACKVFKPAITKATLASWTKKGWLQEHRIGGRVFYLRSEILASAQTLSKYKSVYGKGFDERAE